MYFLNLKHPKVRVQDDSMIRYTALDLYWYTNCNEGFFRQVGDLGILKQPAGGGIPKILECGILSSFLLKSLINIGLFKIFVHCPLTSGSEHERINVQILWVVT